MTLRIAIVTDDPGWHGRQLKSAFADRGVDSRYVSLTQARLLLTAEAAVQLPGFDDGLPDAVFVRGVPGGSLAEVVFHLNVLHALKELGVPVFNDGRAIERSVDKSLTTLRLRRAGIATPDTWVCSNRQQAQAWVTEHAQQAPLVCKPLFGSQGNGVCLISEPLEVPQADAVEGVWYLQRFVQQAEKGFCDWRVFVVDGKAVAAMRREGQSWLSNVAQGASCHPAIPEGPLAELAVAATQCLGMDYAGVDLMRDSDGRWWVIEVNSIPAWKGLQSVTQQPIAAVLADALLARCHTPAMGEMA